MRNSYEEKLLNAATIRAIDSSTNASPIVVTDVAHGLQTGDRVTIISHATNTAANGTWTVTRVDADTFSLDGSTGNGVGGATGTWAKIYNLAALVQDAETAVLAFDTDGGGDASFTVKVVGSMQEDCPDFALAQSPTNQYDFIDVIDMEDGASIDGDTGFAVAGADDHRQFEANVNGLRWLGVLATAGTAGELTVVARIFSNV